MFGGEGEGKCLPISNKTIMSYSAMELGPKARESRAPPNKKKDFGGGGILKSFIIWFPVFYYTDILEGKDGDIN